MLYNAQRRKTINRPEEKGPHETSTCKSMTCGVLRPRRAGVKH